MAETNGETHPTGPASPELARFDFMIGRWQGDGQSRTEDGGLESYRMEWSGRYLLGGHVIRHRHDFSRFAHQIYFNQSSC